jgi:prepilin signal peptidase PulO-like enzyme (type II secretory pathway)
VRYFVVEALTALLFISSLYAAASVPEFVMLLSVSVLAVVIVVYDIRHLIIPDEFTITLTAVAVAYIALIARQGGSYDWLLWSFGAALIGVGFFYFLWFISKGRWIGFGDVKLIFPLGLLVGPTLVFSLIVYSFWIGAAISLLLIGFAKLQRGKLRLHLPMANLTIKSVVPFAPFLVIACLLTLFTQYNVLNLFSFIS